MPDLDTLTVDTLTVDVTTDPPTVDVWVDDSLVVEVVTEGPQGPPGPVADLGVVLGYVVVAVDDYFVLHPQSWAYEQTTPVYVWSILHPLDHRPTVTVTDTAGDECDGETAWPAPNRVTVTFNQPLAGTATLT